MLKIVLEKPFRKNGSGYGIKVMSRRRGVGKRIYGLDILPLQFWWHVWPPEGQERLHFSVGFGLFAIFGGF